jgi:conjugative relaxase-like TrwC/TraI family protein
MLTLVPINNIEYYKNLDQDDYYISEEALGFWHGQLVKTFALKNTVEVDDFENILKFKHPKTKKDLFDSNQNTKRAGWDLTFSAPKSVSILWASEGGKKREQIVEAQIIAVKNTVDYLEMYLAGVKRGKNGKSKEDGSGILAAIVTHFTSRELDCQIHSHTIIPNICLASDKKLMALDSRKIYMNQKILGAVYRSQLATELQKLNYKLEKDDESFRIIDIPKYLEIEFSTRTTQIKLELNKNNISSSSSKRGDLVKLATRKSKVSIELKDLFPIWRKKIESIKNQVVNKAHQVTKKVTNISPIGRLTEIRV